MPADPRLLIPPDCLPGPVPVGAPTRSVCSKCGAAFVRPADSDDEYHPCSACGVLLNGWAGWTVGALDLSPPPLDAAGWPTRVDGADVAAGMLARALGFNPSGARVQMHNGTEAILHAKSAPFSAYFHVWDEKPVEGWLAVNALRDIDPASPLADRLALAAVLRAKPWEAHHAR